MSIATVQDWTPYHRSALWDIHDRYFAERGVAAWLEQDIPCFATSNLPYGRQCAQLLIAIAAELELPEGTPLRLLEVGAGAGGFAATLLRALETDCGPAGESLAANLELIMSDVSPKTAAEAAALPKLREPVERGQVIPARFDIHRPEELETLAGEPIEGPIHVVVANYIACVSRTRKVRWVKGRWELLYARVQTEVDEPPQGDLLAQLLEEPTKDELMADLTINFRWQPCQLEEVFERPLHREVCRELVPPERDCGSLTYPLGFLDFLAAWPSQERGTPFVFVGDYGMVDERELGRTTMPAPNFYGNTLNHQVQFTIFDAFAKRAGWQMERTDVPSDTNHQVLLRPGPIGDGVRATFQRWFREDRATQRIIDYRMAAKALTQAEFHPGAMRFHRRCIELDPDNAEWYFDAGKSAVAASQFFLAVDLFQQGRERWGAERFDFDFQVGRALGLAGQWTDALEWYQRSLQREPHPATFMNMAALHAQRGELAAATRAALTAHQLHPEGEGTKLLAELKEKLWSDFLRKVTNEPSES